MRVSLLLESEPFGQILIETLKSYWQTRYGFAASIRWHQPYWPMARMTDEQVWLGNSYLNLFAPVNVDRGVVENIQREYGRSVRRSRRWPQQAYVGLALHPLTRLFTSPLAFGCTPVVPDTMGVAILGGNRRIRVIAPGSSSCSVALKVGAPASAIDNDIAVRASTPLRWAPRVLASGSGWYEEDFVKGTPINRLAEVDNAAATDEVLRLVWRDLAGATLTSATGIDFSDSRRERVRALAEAPTVDHALSRRVNSLADRLARNVRNHGGNVSVPVAVTHGDLQHGNVLAAVDRAQVVTVIDWESVGFRHAAYDLLTLRLSVRSSADWPERAAAWVQQGPAQKDRHWIGCEGLPERRLTLDCFLLDELVETIADWEMPARRIGRECLDKLTNIERAAA
jgi:hypothetical protein